MIPSPVANVSGGGSSPCHARAVDGVEDNKRVITEMITAVWVRGDLDALGRYWTEDCRNHADPAGRDGLVALRGYHEDFAAQMVGLADVRIEVVQQVGEGDRVVTHLLARARHRDTFAGIAATGREVTLATVRIDRFREGRIAEHWSVADVAGLLRQIRA